MRRGMGSLRRVVLGREFPGRNKFRKIEVKRRIALINTGFLIFECIWFAVFWKLCRYEDNTEICMLVLQIF